MNDVYESNNSMSSELLLIFIELENFQYLGQLLKNVFEMALKKANI